MIEIVCDFCNAPDPAWEYMADEVELPGETLSIGSWCACDACRDLIDTDQREALATRSYDANPVVSLGTIRKVQANFFAARTSGARPIVPTPIHGRLFDR